MRGDDAARRVAGRLPTRFLRGYAAGKLRSDPVYRAVAQRLHGYAQPLFDLGCGIGLLELYLRELGLVMPILAVDHDAAKIKVAAEIAAPYEALEFRTADARHPLPHGMNVVALDILHYFTDSEQAAIVESIAAAVPAGGIALIRDAVRDGSLRYRLTAAQETFSRAIRWLKAERLNFPTRERIVTPFRDRGFSEEVFPLWGRTPFNNYLFVFRRAVSGTTQA
ncbi:MAG TPA: class I SAM-dependent methyltransferase [Thermoanaerobaculia bacterium]|nr:class I SAM-dependent methyltransferase [Thermoanaerobaculia bacterium]